MDNSREPRRIPGFPLFESGGACHHLSGRSGGRGQELARIEEVDVRSLSPRIALYARSRSEMARETRARRFDPPCIGDARMGSDIVFRLLIH
jgi:hypothetical protein